MRVAGTFKPPSIGMRVEPYPISGPGFVEVTGDAVHVEGGKGIPWQVEVGGMLGLIAGFAIAALMYSAHLHWILSLAGIMVGITLGSAAGYRLAGNKLRKTRHDVFPPAALVEVSTNGPEVLITIQFRKRWQTRKQCIHFRPTAASEIPELRAAVERVRVAA